MTSLIIILAIGVVLVVVIWRFTKTSSDGHGIEVVTKSGERRADQLAIDEINSYGDAEVVATDEDPMGEEVGPTNEKRSKSKKGKFEREVEQECIDAIVSNPKDVNPYLKLSVYYIQRQKWADAKEVLLEASKLEPENDRINNNLGIVWFKLKRYNNAISAFERAIKANDKIAHRYVNIGMSYTSLGENDKAAEYFSKAVALDPEQKNFQDLLAEAKGMVM